MKTTQTLSLLTQTCLLWLVFSIPHYINAQSFECTSNLYQVVNGNELKVLIPSTGVYEAVGTSSIPYNGAGFNSEDGYIYGIGSGNILVKVDDTGQGVSQGVIAGFSALSYSGDFDLNGNWFSFRKNGSSWVMNKLDVSSNALAVEVSSITQLAGEGSTSSTADIAYNVISDKFYGMSGGLLIEFDPAALTVKTTGDYSDIADGGAYGAVWSDETGKTYFFNNNTGNIYRADINENGDILSFAFLATSAPNGSNDGMGCALAESPVFPEVCDNGLDDDGDGLIDCEDPDCTATESCGISGKIVSSTFACDQSIATYHTFFTNNSTLSNTVVVTEILPTGFVFLQDTIEFDAGGHSDFSNQPIEGDQGTISWGQITLTGGETVRISYDVVLNESASNGVQGNNVSVALGNAGTISTPSSLSSDIEVGDCPVENTYSCEPAFYQVYKKKGKNEPNVFGKLNPVTGDYEAIAVASDFANGLGYDINSGLVYGASGTRFIQLDANGLVIDQGIAFDKKVYRGDINENSEWYGVVGSDVVKIDVSGTPTIIDTYTGQGLKGWDIAYNMDGHFYSIHNQTLYQFNTVTNTKNTIGTLSGSGLPSSGGYGAQWTGSDGCLYASHNATGNILRINVTTAEGRVVSLSTDGLSKNDGFSCPTEIPVVFEFDYGDNAHLPQSRVLSYRQDLNQDDVPDLSTFWLGSTVNFEGSDPSNINATGDLDDGFTLTTEVEDGTLTALVGLNTNIAGTAYYLIGFDWNDDGIFDEVISSSAAINTAFTSLDVINVPTGFEEGMINVRVIISEVALTETNISGDILDLGEVEDYRYQIALPCEGSDCDTSTGSNGGLESNGTLANAIAKRNYTRVKNNNKSHIKAYQQELRAYKMARITSDNQLSSYFPNIGATGNEIVAVSSPTDLIDITNATDVFAADYYIDDVRIAASLLLTTEDAVYNHSKNVCDRLNGKSIENVQLVTLDQVSIILAKIVQESNGKAEYSAWFSAKDHGDYYEIFSQWNVDNYPAGEYLNFQVWSSSPKQVFHMTNHILDQLREEKSVNTAISTSQLPRVMVKKGQYENGQLKLTLLNYNAISSVTLETNSRKTEQSGFVNDKYTISLNGDAEQEIVVETGYLFDAGISVTAEGSEAFDALYLADGAWGMDYNQFTTTVDAFVTLEVQDAPAEEEYLVERGFTAKGSSNDVVNVFRNLKSGEKSLMLSSYNTMSFDIMNSHAIEVVLVEKGLVAWEDRLKVQISAHTEMTHVVLSLSDFVGQQNTTDLDIQSVVFSYINQSGTVEQFEFSVDQLIFGDEAIIMSNDTFSSNEDFNIYPNPASNLLKINTSSAGDITIYNMNGKVVLNEAIAGSQIENEISLSLNPGIYHVRFVDGENRHYKKLIVR